MKFSDRVYYRKVFFALPLPQVSVSRSVYVSLIKGDNKNILIDSGVSYNYPDLVNLCAEAGLTLADIDILFLTHYHPDHIGGLPRLQQENPKMEIWAHEHCKEMVEDPDKHFAHRPLYGFRYLVPGAAKVAHVLTDGEVIDLGGVTAKVLFTPGHSADSVSLYLPEESLILAGDALPPIGEMPIYDSIADVRASLKRLSEVGAEHLLSSFTGIWDNSQGDWYEKTVAFVDAIQAAVDHVWGEKPGIAPEELAVAVLKELGIPGAAMGIVVKTLMLHVKK